MGRSRRALNTAELINAEITLTRWEAGGDEDTKRQALMAIAAQALVVPTNDDPILVEICNPWPWLADVAFSAFDAGNLHLVARACALAEQWYGPDRTLMTEAGFADLEMGSPIDVMHADLVSTGLAALAPLSPDHEMIGASLTILRAGEQARALALRALTLSQSLGRRGIEFDTGVLSLAHQVLTRPVVGLLLSDPTAGPVGDRIAEMLSAGRWDEAIVEYERRVTELIRSQGAQHLRTIDAQHDLAVTYLKAGKIEQSSDVLERTLTNALQALGDRHPMTLTVMGSLAKAYLSAGQFPEQVVGMLEHVTKSLQCDPSDPVALANQYALAQSYEAAGRRSDAIRLHQEVLDARARVLGPDHEDTRASAASVRTAEQE